MYNKEDYLKKAIEIAENPKKYKKIKDKINQCKNSGKYFNSKQYTLNLEKAYKKIHQMRVENNKFDNVFITE